MQNPNKGATKNFKFVPSLTDPSLIEIRFEGGGEVPEGLGGLWTVSHAQKAVDQYLELRKPKKK